MSGFATLLSAAGTALGALATPAASAVAIWFLAGVFAWSGLAKLRKPALAAMALVDFRVARRVRPPLGAALGTAEVLLAAALALGLLPRLTLALTAGLLWLFALLIARSLWAGMRFACFCFGEADDQLSFWTLARTSALALVASTAVITTPPTLAHTPWASASVLQALVGLALLSTIALVGTIPRLWRWNSGPLALGSTPPVEVGR